MLLWELRWNSPLPSSTNTPLHPSIHLPSLFILLSTSVFCASPTKAISSQPHASCTLSVNIWLLSQLEPPRLHCTHVTSFPQAGLRTVTCHHWLVSILHVILEDNPFVVALRTKPRWKIVPASIFPSPKLFCHWKIWYMCSVLWGYNVAIALLCSSPASSCMWYIFFPECYFWIKYFLGLWYYY